MTDSQKKYYKDMLANNRGRLCVKDDHVIAVVTFFIGDDDDKYLYTRDPWTVIPDEPSGGTVYIDQLLIKDKTAYRYLHRELTDFVDWVKYDFPNVKRAKWVRVNAAFRKHGLKEGVKSNVHIKNFKP